MGEFLLTGRAARKDIALAIAPIAARQNRSSGEALLEELLDHVGLSDASLASKVMSSELGQVILGAGKAIGRADAATRLPKVMTEADLPAETLNKLQSAVSPFAASLMPGLELPSTAQPTVAASGLASEIARSTGTHEPGLSTFASAMKMSRASARHNVSKTLVHDGDVQS